MKKEELILLIKKIAEEISINKDFLTQLDAEIGDADHGVNMARGFDAIKEKLDEYSSFTISQILIDIGKIIVTVTAGTSGALYGSAFKTAGRVVTEKEEISIIDFSEMLKSGIEKIQSLGGAIEGEKTMIDSMIPSLDSLNKSLDDPKKALKSAVESAKKGVEFTKTIKATKGRASYLGDRSIGHQDPGATSYTIILECIEQFTK